MAAKFPFDVLNSFTPTKLPHHKELVLTMSRLPRNHTNTYMNPVLYVRVVFFKYVWFELLNEAVHDPELGVCVNPRTAWPARIA